MGLLCSQAGALLSEFVAEIAGRNLVVMARLLICQQTARQTEADSALVH